MQTSLHPVATFSSGTSACSPIQWRHEVSSRISRSRRQSPRSPLRRSSPGGPLGDAGIARTRHRGSDRCVTDAVALVANCRLGKRALKFRDWGKVAATFVDLKTGRAVRIAAKESSKQAAREMFPELEKEAGQQKAYAQLSDEILFDKKWVKVEVQPEDLPGFKGPRVLCAECGEGINFKREVQKDGRVLCRSCAGEKYYRES